MLNRELHRRLTLQIIKAIFISPIGPYVAFKGGAACYFLYGLDRFSLDLDFDVIREAPVHDEFLLLLETI